VHRAGAARRAPDARRAAVPQHAVQRRQRRGHGVVLHPVRVHLPDHPVLPVRPRLRPAVHRGAPAPGRLAVGAGSVAGTQLAVRAGTKLIVTTGLVAMAVFYGWVAATTSATLSYGIIAAQMVLYGLGLGLTSAPATESIMGAISPHKARVGSAVNDSTRLVGGTLGVAVIGSVYASVYASHLTATMPAAVPGRVAAIAHQSVGAAYLAAGKIAALGHPALGLALQHASTNAFL